MQATLGRAAKTRGQTAACEGGQYETVRASAGNALPTVRRSEEAYLRAVTPAPYDKLFAARVLETPTREEVLKRIAIALPEAGVNSSDELSEEPTEGQDSPHAHYVAYHRLRNTGWLVEEQEKWDVFVDMDPDAFMVMGAISDLTNSRIRVAGAVGR